MKKIVLRSLAFSAIMVFTISCKSVAKEDKSAAQGDETKTESSSKDYNIDADASIVEWMGSTLVGKEHLGTIKIKEGKLGTNGNTVVNGAFTIDMNSIANTDILDKSNSDKLVAHLKDADFFDTEKHQMASLTILSITPILPPTAVANNNVKANLTIKGITKEIAFPAIIKVSDIGVLASASFEINRKDWGISYGTEGSIIGLAKDKTIKNEIKLTVSLIAK